jgi:agmatinase
VGDPGRAVSGPGARGLRASSYEALALVRGLRGLDFVGFDLVEVAPQYDSAGQVTALLAANLLFEFLSLVALNR